jgi:hypothetical protein
MRFIYLIYALPLCFGPLAAQGNSGSSIGAPLLGYVFDHALTSVRPIAGLPGAAVLEKPLNPGFAVASAAVASDLAFILAVSAEDGQVRLIQVRQGGIDVQPLRDVVPSPDRMVLSPRGRAAIFYNQSAARIQILTGLPDAPALTREVSTAGLSAAAGGLAVSDDGQAALFTAGGNGSAVWLFAAGADPIQLSLADSAAAVDFRRDHQDAIALTRGGDLYRIDSAGAVTLYGRITGDTNLDPVAIRISPDGSRAFAAYTSGAVSVFDTLAGTSTTTFCQCKPTGLDPLQAGTLFRLTEPAGAPVMLFDASQPEPRFWFIPAGQPASEPQGSQL